MEIYFDPQIRNWVFVPLLVGLLILAKVKQNIQRILAGGPKKEAAVTSEQGLEAQRNGIKLLRAKKFISHCNLLPHSSFLSRASYFCHAEKGLLARPEPIAENPLGMMANNPMANPEAMAGMLKGNLMLILTMGLQYWGVSHFFSGMLVGRVSFPVPQKFRETLQKGVEVLNIDVKYISALSLYFLTFFGMDKLLALLFPRGAGEAEPEPAAAQANPMAAMGMPAADGQKKDFDSLIAEIKMAKHAFLLENALGDFADGHAHLLSAGRAPAP